MLGCRSSRGIHALCEEVIYDALMVEPRTLDEIFASADELPGEVIRDCVVHMQRDGMIVWLCRDESGAGLWALVDERVRLAIVEGAPTLLSVIAHLDRMCEQLGHQTISPILIKRARGRLLARGVIRSGPMRAAQEATL